MSSFIVSFGAAILRAGVHGSSAMGGARALDDPAPSPAPGAKGKAVSTHTSSAGSFQARVSWSERSSHLSNNGQGGEPLKKVPCAPT